MLIGWSARAAGAWGSSGRPPGRPRPEEHWRVRNLHQQLRLRPKLHQRQRLRVCRGVCHSGNELSQRGCCASLTCLVLQHDFDPSVQRTHQLRRRTLLLLQQQHPGSSVDLFRTLPLSLHRRIQARRMLFPICQYSMVFWHFLHSEWVECLQNKDSPTRMRYQKPKTIIRIMPVLRKFIVLLY